MAINLKTKNLTWTNHSKAKMNYYKLSPARVRRVLNSPMRIEEGIAPDTIAVMQPVTMKKIEKGKEDWSQEIWVMLEENKNERKIISVWRYPGRTKAGEPIPESIRNEMMSLF